MTKRLIDADALALNVANYITSNTYIEQSPLDVAMTLLNWIQEAPTIEAKHGHWLTWEEQFPESKVSKKSRLGVFCSVCHMHADNGYNFCPTCGADCRGVPDDKSAEDNGNSMFDKLKQNHKNRR